MVARLDSADDLSALVALRRRSYDLLRLRPGTTVVDVGTGTGRAVAELLGYGVRAIGVDTAEDMIGVARRRYPHADFRMASAYRLPFRDMDITGYRADKVFHQLSNPVAAISEAVRVLAPGGRIVLAGQDWDTVAIEGDDTTLTRRIVQARADTIAHPTIARTYHELLRDGGFGEIESDTHSLVFTDTLAVEMLHGFAHAARKTGAVTQAESRTWLDEQRRRALDGHLMLTVPLFIAAGTA